MTTVPSPEQAENIKAELVIDVKEGQDTAP